MRLTMRDRKTLAKALAEQYQRAGKKHKGKILDQFVQATRYKLQYNIRTTVYGTVLTVV